MSSEGSEEAEFIPGVIKVKLGGKCDRCGGCASEKSESGTVRHVDSGTVMDGE